MGTVYRAKHRFLDIYAAIKVLHIQYSKNPQFKERFINEAVALSKLDSPYIVKIRDFFEEDQNLFLVMEYVRGIGLDQYIRNVFGPIPENRSKEIFRKILAGVHSAHLKGVIHRDIKPSNIILENDDTPKILDFGIAKLMDTNHSLTNPGSRMGSVIYMSPEQILGRDVDLKTDIYSLGITLYEMITGRNPYDTLNATEYVINSMIVNETIPSPRTIYPHISADIEEIILKATSKNANDRYNNCEEFLSSIVDIEFVEGQSQNPDFSGTEVDKGVFQDSTRIVESEAAAGNKTSSELLKEVKENSAIRKIKHYSYSNVYSSRKNTFILLGVFLFLITTLVVIYAVKNIDPVNVKKDVIIEQPQKKEKTGENNQNDKKIDKTVESPKTVDQKDNSKSKTKKKQPTRRNDYDQNPSPKRPRTTFDN